jgi:flagellar motor switch protein FliN
MASTVMIRLSGELADAVARAFLPMRAAVRATGIAEVPQETGFLGWAQPLTIAPGAPIWLAAAEQTWSTFEETFPTFASRAITEFASALTLRAEIGVEAGPPAAAEFFRLDIELGGQHYAVFAGLPSALAHALEKEKRESQVQSASVDLLLDVELPVSVSFGRASLPVREVLRMTTGSMIELNRHVNDYVDVIVNNCVIARGEVVVIEGNYGIRVHEIVSRRERAMIQHIGRGGAPHPSAVKASI